MSQPAIEVKNVSILFNMNKEKVDNLKEYFLKLVKHQLMFTEFWALRDISFSVEKAKDSEFSDLTEQAKVRFSKQLPEF